MILPHHQLLIPQAAEVIAQWSLILVIPWIIKMTRKLFLILNVQLLVVHDGSTTLNDYRDLKNIQSDKDKIIKRVFEIGDMPPSGNPQLTDFEKIHDEEMA